ncbi:MAG: VWA domain-containing protein [Planctomycetes bacterium]|nr:VWA domain-containing protein [Planctomycetota bacterium]
MKGTRRERSKTGWDAAELLGTLFELLCMILLPIAGCDRGDRPGATPAPVAATPNVPAARPSAQPAPYGDANQIPLPAAQQRLCTAVVILLDTSGSMTQAVGDRAGGRSPKHQIARQALERIVNYTIDWKKTHPDRDLELGLFTFSSSARAVLPMGPFDAGKSRSALASLTKPGGGTAIGDALRRGFEALYASGCVRKYVICITDGENTTGPRPDRIARQLYAQTGGEVEIHFIAFDTSAKRFGFLESVNGHIVEAADGAQLEARISDIYEKRILAEAMPAEQP